MNRKRRYYKQVQSPLDDNPFPKDFTLPKRKKGKFEIRCPNGEVLEYESYEVAIQAYRQLKKGI